MGHSTLKTCCIFIPMGDSTVPRWPTNLNLHFSVFTTIFLHYFGLKPSNREIWPRPGDFSHREISCQTGRSPGGHREVARLAGSQVTYKTPYFFFSRPSLQRACDHFAFRRFRPDGNLQDARNFFCPQKSHLKSLNLRLSAHDLLRGQKTSRIINYLNL